MFDPTIYENLKVVLEGAVYDLDLNQEIMICDRKDLVDLATMSRTYQIQFHEVMHNKFPTAEIMLHASMKDLSLEIIDNNEQDAGCILGLHFYTDRTDYTQIEKDLRNIWSDRPTITQEITYTYGQEEKINKISISFGRKINEAQIDDLNDIIELTVTTLKYLA